MKNLILFACSVLIAGSILLISCNRDDGSDAPPKAGIFYSIADKQVAFTSLTKRVVSWAWDFGDGETSTEANPVHVYASGGYYTVTLTGTDAAGETAVAEADIAVALTPYVLLTGGPTNTTGKKWKISSAHSSKDAFCLADDNFTVVQPIGSGMLGNVGLGIGEVYDDIFTFKFNGSYVHSPQHGGAFAGLVYTSITGKTIIKVTPTSQSFGLCYTAWTPETGATFTLNENKNLSITTVNTAGTVTTDRTYKGVSTLTFSGTEFVGFMDFTRECILQEVTDQKMRLAMFVCTTTKSYYNKPSYAVILTFEAIP